MTYRFIGSSAGLADGTELDRFGQAVDLESEYATAIIARNVPLLPESVFHEIGFTDAELAEHSLIALHENAPAEFLEKRQHAWELLHEFREGLRAAPDAQHNTSAPAEKG